MLHRHIIHTVYTTHKHTHTHTHTHTETHTHTLYIADGYLRRHYLPSSIKHKLLLKCYTHRHITHTVLTHTHKQIHYTHTDTQTQTHTHTYTTYTTHSR